MRVEIIPEGAHCIGNWGFDVIASPGRDDVNCPFFGVGVDLRRGSLRPLFEGSIVNWFPY
jgi:hypothetical protein